MLPVETGRSHIFESSAFELLTQLAEKFVSLASSNSYCAHSATLRKDLRRLLFVCKPLLLIPRWVVRSKYWVTIELILTDRHHTPHGWRRCSPVVLIGVIVDSTAFFAVLFLASLKRTCIVDLSLGCGEGIFDQFFCLTFGSCRSKLDLVAQALSTNRPLH